MSFPINSRPALNLLSLPLLQQAQIAASVLRLDAVHPVISGNKWYKLKGYLAQAAHLGKKGIVTFGGAYSNHIVATAAACAQAGLQSIGIIRGEEPECLSPTLQDALHYGMQLLFISRSDYREKTLPLALLENGAIDNWLLVGEGGYGREGMIGAGHILAGVDAARFTHIICAVGTGTTLAGLGYHAQAGQKIIGIAALKNNRELLGNIQQLLPARVQPDLTLLHDFHFGGYAKHTPALLQFMNQWYQQTGIPSDFVYTGKMFAAFQDLVTKGYFPPGSQVLLIHTGGLQGNRSLRQGTLIFQG